MHAAWAQLGTFVRGPGRWQYAPASTELPATEKLISGAIDVRLPLSFDQTDLDMMADVLLAAVEVNAITQWAAMRGDALESTIWIWLSYPACGMIL